MRRGLSYHNRRSSGGYNPFSQLGPTLDLTFAGNVTDLLDPNGFTLDTNFIAPQYLIGAQYTIWETGVGLVSKTFSQIITFTRTGTNATYFNSAGVLVNAGADVPRFDYDPSTLAAQGLLFEEQRTNSIRNNTMQGAVAGTPGTAPTNWFAATPSNGLNRQIVGTGTENGINYIDVRYSGTTSAASLTAIYWETATQVAAASGQTWTNSVYVALVGGSTANTTGVVVGIDENNGAGGFLTGSSTTFVPSAGALAGKRVSHTRTLTNASTAFVWPYVFFSYANGAAIDITLRIGLPQLEQGAFATSVIPTTTTALTRSADVASVNPLSPWYNATAGTLYAEYSIPFALTTSGNASIARLLGSGGTGVNDIALFVNQPSGKNISHNIWTSSTNVGRLDAASAFAANTAIKTAAAFTANDRAVTSSGTAATTSVTAFAMPTVTSLFLGSDGNGAQLTNGYLRRITYYPRRLSNAELQAITA